MIHCVENLTSWWFVNVHCRLPHNGMVLPTLIDTLRQFLYLLTNTEFPEYVIVNFDNKLEFAAVELLVVLTLANHAHAQIAGHRVWCQKTQAWIQFTKVQFLDTVSCDVSLTS